MTCNEARAEVAHSEELAQLLQGGNCIWGCQGTQYSLLIFIIKNVNDACYKYYGRYHCLSDYFWSTDRGGTLHKINKWFPKIFWLKVFTCSTWNRQKLCHCPVLDCWSTGRQTCRKLQTCTSTLMGWAGQSSILPFFIEGAVMVCWREIMTITVQMLTYWIYIYIHLFPQRPFTFFPTTQLSSWKRIWQMTKKVKFNAEM